MPLAPRDEIERIKREVSVQRLAEARGIKLKRSGKELIGLCPFHKDTNPSLHIDPAKNQWHCKGACSQGGDVFQWMMKAEGISFKHALEMLRRDVLPLTSARSGPPPKKGTTVKLAPLVDSTADDHMNDQKLLHAVVSHYQETLKQTPEAQQYLINRGLQSAEMVERFRLGYANRTLGYRLPASTRRPGKDVRGHLQRLGVLREESGHEHFWGSLVIPIFNLQGEVVEMYGRKITPAAKLRENTPLHMYLEGPRRGVWNEEALIASKEIILCEALIDALTFWCAGYRHVTSIYGVNGLTDDHRAAFQKHGTKRIYIAYDRDEAGDKAAEKHAAEFLQMGLECFRVQFPKGMDANEYARTTQPAAKALGLLLNSATWLGKGQSPKVNVIAASVMEPAVTPEAQSVAAPAEEPAAKEKSISVESGPIVSPEIPPLPAVQIETEGKIAAARTQQVFSLAANQEAVSHQAADVRATPGSPDCAAVAQAGVSMPLTVQPLVEIDGEEINVILGPRKYRVLNLHKNTTRGAIKVNVRVSGENARGELMYFGDDIDLEAAKLRMSFTKQAAHELGVKEETIYREVGKLWRVLEDLQRELIKKALHQDTPAEKPTMTAEEQDEALQLLRDPRLLDRILEDFDKCGVVGEETNKIVSYLAAVSRLLKKPLGIIVQASSSSGKTSLMEAVLDFIPEDQRESYTAMTGQSLFYMGEKDLKHKILAIAEQQGAERASYPLKLLQSEGKLKIASTGKDSVTGKQVTHEYTVEGPVMTFFTTTNEEVDEELMNRCIVLTVDEEREQTRAIHKKQRAAQTLEGHWARRQHTKIIQRQRNAQRLLRPIVVVMREEDVEGRDFPDAMTRTRRDHAKFLTLISTIALLHQHQREIKTETRDGDTLEYIEASPADVELAWKLVTEVLTPALDELHAQTRRLLVEIDGMVKRECERLQMERYDYRFSRATVRQFTRWSDSQLKTHLHRLEELEYLLVHRGGRGQSYVYEMRYELDENGKLTPPVYRYDGKKSGPEGEKSGLEKDKSGPSLGWSGRGPDQLSPTRTRARSDFSKEVWPNGNAYNAYKEAEAGEGLQNPAIAAPKPNGAVKPNGHAAPKRDGVK